MTKNIPPKLLFTGPASLTCSHRISSKVIKINTLMRILIAKGQLPENIHFQSTKPAKRLKSPKSMGSADHVMPVSANRLKSMVNPGSSPN